MDSSNSQRNISNDDDPVNFPQNCTNKQNKDNTKKSRVPTDAIRRVPPFCLQRMFNSLSSKQSSSLVSIKQCYTPMLNNMSLSELHELLEKQDKLLQNKALLSKLTDKGKKISEFREKLLETIKSKEEVDQTSQMLSQLSLSSSQEELTKQSKTYKSSDLIQKLNQNIMTVNPRFNVPNTKEATVSATDKHNDDFHQAHLKMSHEIQTLDLDQSLQTLQSAVLKNKHIMADQISRFYSHKSTRESDDSDFEYDNQQEEEEDDEDQLDSNDSDAHVNVHFNSSCEN